MALLINIVFMYMAFFVKVTLKQESYELNLKIILINSYGAKNI